MISYFPLWRLLEKRRYLPEKGHHLPGRDQRVHLSEAAGRRGCAHGCAGKDMPGAQCGYRGYMQLEAINDGFMLAGGKDTKDSRSSCVNSLHIPPILDIITIRHYRTSGDDSCLLPPLNECARG